MMNLIERVSKLEREVISFKTSQTIGSSSGRCLLVGTFDESGTLYNLGESFWWIVRFRASSSPFPLMMVRVKVYLDGTEVSWDDSRIYIFESTSDALMARIDLAEISGENFGYPEEGTAYYDCGIGCNMSGQHTIRLAGQIYATCEGIPTIYTGGVHL